MAKLSERKKQRIFEDLHRALRAKKTPPIRPSHIASKHSIRSSTIRYNFPKEYKELIARRSAWENDLRRKTHQSSIESLTQGIFSLVRQGIYPSERKLRDLKYLRSFEIRRPDLKHILESFQDMYKAYGYLDD